MTEEEIKNNTLRKNRCPIMENELNLFLRISTYLTGFNEVELQGTGMVQTYYDFVQKKMEQETLTCFYEAVNGIFQQYKTEAQINEAIALQLIPDADYNGLAKKMITMWYEGNWIEDAATFDIEVISAESYIQGLMWEAAETHPPGAKQPGFGSWAQLPLNTLNLIKSSQNEV
jgi:hypothetical protein